MKKQVSLFLTLVLILAFTVPVPASAAIGFIYDETEQMDCPDLEELYFSLFEFAQRTGIQTELYVFTYEDGLVLSDLAQVLYEDDTTEKDGYISLLLQVHPDSDGWYLDKYEGWCLYSDEVTRTLYPDLLQTLETGLAPYLSGDHWNGAIAEDREAFCNIGQQYLNILCRITDMPHPGNMQHIYDEAGLLLPAERQELDAMAATISNTYGCGVYIVTVDDYRDYGTGYDVFETTWQLYHANNMGYGTDRQGMVLLLSMDDRDFATFFYGADVEYAFDAYGQQKLEEYFLDNFADNDWYGGFRDYLQTADEFLSKAAGGNPVRENQTGFIALFVLAALVISAIATLVLWRSMNNVSLQRSAAVYAAPEGLNLTRRSDTFLHVTRTRRKIQTSSGTSGSRSHSGGGGSGRSGKF